MVGVVAMVFTALSYAQMVRAFPMAGSVYNYVGRGIGAPVGFLAGWAISLDYLLVPCLLSLVAAVAMHATVPAVPVSPWLVGFVVFTTTLSTARDPADSGGHAVVPAVGELVVLAVFLVFAVRALLAGEGAGLHWSTAVDPFYNPDTFSWSAGVRRRRRSRCCRFLGFDGISMLAEESKGGARQVGRAMTAALALAGAAVHGADLGRGDAGPGPGEA